ncbi:hypothetical protein GCM10007108_08150 [Thermogymnomonas acidicola]|uniref:Uncharacterized protein n=1 Tax=Thermogymnomonas acidicola TaxID=399579 RepID=A0AA37BR20_9ARCH|nr:hypothetical protein [Thermogymnomonas acidicola]GGM72332.1 hypothetical protein GCM10007108_08150 [Thermogymnomonas acidicola]
MSGYRNSNYRNGNYRGQGWSDRGPQQRRVKKLDMSRSEEFSYLLGRIVEPLPESVRGAIMGGIYSIASKKGANEAKEFIVRKRQEGVIDSEMGKKLIDLIFDYSKYR